MLCHGQGDLGEDPFNGGCCWIAGTICPVRWFIDYSTSTPGGDVGTATILDSTGVSLGTVFDYVDNLMPGGGPNKAARVQRVLDQVQGVSYVCSAAAVAIGNDPSLINDRPAFETAWEATAEYQAVADQWEAQGKPRNWCQTFGPGEGHCCFGEDQATNDVKRGNMTTTAVTVRSRAQGAS